MTEQNMQNAREEEFLNTDQADFFGKWAGGGTTDSQKAAAEYDCLSEVYEQQVAQWKYNCHDVAAELLKKFLPVQGKILDLGCGTGLAGEALAQQGYQHITGADISEKSLALAEKKKVYTELHQADAQQLLPFADKTFDAVICTAVLTYIADPEALLNEFCRVVRPQGYILFTNRTDIHSQRNYPSLLQAMEKQGMLEPAYLSSAMPYMPENPEYSDKIRIFYCVYKVVV